MYASQPEIHNYFKAVADKYNISSHVKFRSMVQSAVWDEQSATWLVTIQNLSSKTTYQRRTKILVSAVGALSIPKQCEIPGKDDFSGTMFHSAQWNHSFDWKDKEVVVIGE